MKINRQLRLELERYQRQNEPAEEPPKQTQQKKYKSPKTRELVAGGDIKWKPVDRAAAMLLSKPNHLHYPPQEKKKSEPVKQSPKQQRTMSEKLPYSQPVNSRPSFQNGGQGQHDKSETEMSMELHRGFVNQSEKSLKETVSLLSQAMDARDSMDIMAESWKVSWSTFQETTGERLKELRMNRMAMDSETRQLMAALREVRSFFADKNHSEEVERLREFVGLCERLKAMKESGFLDTVADTMIRLA